VHPVVSIRDFDRSYVRVPCFLLEGDRCALLPSFGSFTGGYLVRPGEGCRAFLASEKKVVRIQSD